MIGLDTYQYLINGQILDIIGYNLYIKKLLTMSIKKKKVNFFFLIIGIITMIITKIHEKGLNNQYVVK